MYCTLPQDASDIDRSILDCAFLCGGEHKSEINVFEFESAIKELQERCYENAYIHIADASVRYVRFGKEANGEYVFDEYIIAGRFRTQTDFRRSKTVIFRTLSTSTKEVTLSDFTHPDPWTNILEFGTCVH